MFPPTWVPAGLKLNLNAIGGKRNTFNLSFFHVWKNHFYNCLSLSFMISLHRESFLVLFYGIVNSTWFTLVLAICHRKIKQPVQTISKFSSQRRWEKPKLSGLFTASSGCVHRCETLACKMHKVEYKTRKVKTANNCEGYVLITKMMRYAIVFTFFVIGSAYRTFYG